VNKLHHKILYLNSYIVFLIIKRIFFYNGGVFSSSSGSVQIKFKKSSALKNFSISVSVIGIAPLGFKSGANSGSAS
jgi:recombination DNA repair RAD52 pathway protein